MDMRKLAIKKGAVETGICKWVIVHAATNGAGSSSVGVVAGKGHLFIAARITKQTAILLVDVRLRPCRIAQITRSVAFALLLYCQNLIMDQIHPIASTVVPLHAGVRDHQLGSWR
jgi:hypothetical protein